MTSMIQRASIAATAMGIAATLLVSHAAVAQAASKIPVRALGAITATSKDSLGPVVVRALSNGSVMVNDIVRRRVLLFD
ncbi:MAG: hypothetical protein ABJB74_15035, partial [Gemmatimonas sp.]